MSFQSGTLYKHGADRLSFSKNTMKWQRKAFGKWVTIRRALICHPKGSWTALSNDFVEYHGLNKKPPEAQ